MNIQILNKVEASRKSKVSQKTIYSWAKKGRINKYWVKDKKTFQVSLQEILNAR